MANTLPYSAPTVYTKKATSVAEYSKMRGVTDFTNAAQFNLYEKGYQMLFVLAIPNYLEELRTRVAGLDDMLSAFVNIIENEFKGASGFDDITTEELEITDNISTLNVIGKVVKQSNAEITTSYTEKSSSIITNTIKYYLEGIRDPRTQAKTYHGLIKNGILAPGFENEVFTLLYVVTDNTCLMLEKAYLMCNAYPTSAKTSIYEGEKGQIEKVDIDINWKCFLIDGDEVDKRAIQLLVKNNEEGAVANAYGTIKGDNGTRNADSVSVAQKQDQKDHNEAITLGYNSYQYSVLDNVDSAINGSN